MALGRLICFLIFLVIGFPVHADDWDDNVKWEWKCRPSGFYGMDVSPNGQFKPIAEQSMSASLGIRVHYSPGMCGDPYMHDSYVIEITGNKLFGGLVNQTSCEDYMNLEFKDTPKPAKGQAPEPCREDGCGHPLERLEDSVARSTSPVSIILQRDDNDWRFIMSVTELTTEREERKTRILVPPQPGIKYEALANSVFLTGECLLTLGK
jgi:hypothetical protein